MEHSPRNPISNYKNACLLLGFFNVMWVFATLWLLYGLATVLVLAATLNHLITRLDLKLARQQYFGR